MKLVKIALVISCVLSAVLSRRSHARDISSAAFKSRVECSKDDDCKAVCSNFRIVAKGVACHKNICQNKVCHCAPEASVTGLTAEDKCQYADASTISIPTPKKANQAAKNKRRRRRY